jgi:transcriptional regulator with XRE-family HTH domain
MPTNKQIAGQKLAENMARMMKNRHLTQTALADLSGVSQSTIATILAGKARQMEWYTLYRLAKGLNCPMEDLIEGGQTKIIDNPDLRRLVDAMPSGAKAFFRASGVIPKDDIDAVIKIMEIIMERHKKKRGS